jgi:hypothetical protein
MEPIADLGALRPILDSLKQKGLIISLTSEGRGHVLTHALYEERELEKLRAEYQGQSHRTLESDDEPAPTPRSTSAPIAATSPKSDEVANLRAEVRELQEQLTRLREEFDQLAASLR